MRERDGKSLWEKTFRYIPASHLGTNFIAISQDDEKRPSLILLDLKNGKQIARRVTPKAEAVTVDANTVYALSGATLRLFNAKLTPGKTIKLADRTSGREAQLAISGDYIAAALYGDKWVVLNKKTGKKLWELRDKYAGLYPMVLAKGLMLLHGDGRGVFEARTGRRAWDPSGAEWAAVSGNICLLHERRDYVARDWTTGRQLWRASGAPDYSGGNDGGSVAEDGKTFFTDGDHLTAFSLNGQRLWTANIRRPEIAYKDRWIVLDGDRIFGYASGQPIQIPADSGGRELLAHRLVRDFELLDNQERDLLVPLAREAVGPLLTRYSRWAKEYEVLEAKGGSDSRNRSQTLYGLLEGDSGRRLDKMLTKADTPLLISTIREVKSPWWRDRVLIPMLVAHGDIEQATPFLLEQVRKDKEPEGALIEAVSKSRHPDAVKFLIEALNDPKAPEALRRAAFIHLAGTGGTAGVAAVRNAMPQPGPRPRWQSRVEIGATDRRSKPKEAKDSKGRTWVLFQSDALGNYSDYYMAEKVGSRFGEPVFLGFYDKPTWHKEAPTEYRKVPIAKLVSTEWIKLFPDDVEVRKDTDADGLTDLVEARLGTNPTVADTDGDGLRDDVDPCPNAAPRAMGDREQIVAAAVAAQFFGDGWGVPAVISVKNVEPFEMAGYPEPLLWIAEGREGPLDSMYGTGVNRISFSPAIRDSDQKITEDTDWLQISADGKTARTLIRRYSGGLNGEGIEVVLQKVGDDWFVTDMILAYVS